MSNNIVLIGYMGVGKGRTARLLAAKTPYFTVDSDDLIESYINLKVKKIFSLYGEKKFRSLERQTACWFEESVSSTIISTGGGFFKVPNIKKIGRVVYLHAEFKTIIDRMLDRPNASAIIKKRPLLADLKKAKKLYKKRLPQYRKVADLEVSLEDRTLDQVSDEIITTLRLDTK